MAPPVRPLLATEIYALSQGARCSGPYECHWCGAPCESLYSTPRPCLPIGVKAVHDARRPANPFVCHGCRLFRKDSVTATLLHPPRDGDGFVDRQRPQDWSWFVDGQAWALRKDAGPSLYPKLLNPPLRFALALVEPGTPNLLQFAPSNDLSEVDANTPLWFALNNRPMHFTVYQLEEALRTGPDGKDPGVQALVRMFGGFRLPPRATDRPEKMGRGRPKPLAEAKDLVTRAVARSGC